MLAIIDEAQSIGRFEIAGACSCFSNCMAAGDENQDYIFTVKVYIDFRSDFGAKIFFLLKKRLLKRLNAKKRSTPNRPNID